ncbi:MAG: hypothetical protein IKF49_10150, partial [Clostridia bacterium]|nr:hypothetical protein [Clostridia bacterium]
PAQRILDKPKPASATLVLPRTSGVLVSCSLHRPRLPFSCACWLFVKDGDGQLNLVCFSSL